MFQLLCSTDSIPILSKTQKSLTFQKSILIRFLNLKKLFQLLLLLHHKLFHPFLFSILILLLNQLLKLIRIRFIPWLIKIHIIRILQFFQILIPFPHFCLSLGFLLLFIRILVWSNEWLIHILPSVLSRVETEIIIWIPLYLLQ